MSLKPMNETALSRHNMIPYLPHPTHFTQQHIPKSKEFYRPQQFIWDNPHRTSKQVYKFYHKYNDRFANTRQTQIEALEQQDRKEEESQRINRIIQHRQQTRTRFYFRQKERLTLETRTFMMPNNKSTLEPNRLLPSDERKLTAVRSERVHKIHESYLEGLDKFDEKMGQLDHLVNAQRTGFHEKMRSDFELRKKTNHLVTAKITRNSRMQDEIPLMG